MTMRIHEIFASIQGETGRAGLLTIFVRTSSCNMDCPWCDTMESRETWTELEPAEIVERVAGFAVPRVCVTGGEPLLEPEVPELVSRLLSEGCEVSVETNGSLPIDVIDRRASRVVDVKPPSAYGPAGGGPGFLLANLATLGPGDALKFVIGDRADLEAAVGFIETHDLASGPWELLFSPLHGHYPATAVVAEILAKRWMNARLNLQVHKIVFGIEARGV
jgi:7-carboxy-7-deazaguanine synthase